MTYGKAAKFYDLFGEKPDVEFYLEQALLSRGRVLEPGVGTGRLALELARSGINVVGIDNSRDMLRVARRTLTKEPMEVRRRVLFKEGDMRDFGFRERFSMIYIPSSTFDHLTEVEDRRRSLRCVYINLEDGGRFIFDVEQPPPGVAPRSWWIERKDLGKGRMVVRSGFTTSNLREKKSTLHLFFDLYRNGKLIERYYEYGTVAIFTRRELVGLLKETGFKVEAVYGDFDKSKHGLRSPRMVFVARKGRRGPDESQTCEASRSCDHEYEHDHAR